MRCLPNLRRHPFRHRNLHLKPMTTQVNDMPFDLPQSVSQVQTPMYPYFSLLTLSADPNPNPNSPLTLTLTLTLTLRPEL